MKEAHERMQQTAGEFIVCGAGTRTLENFLAALSDIKLFLAITRIITQSLADIPPPPPRSTVQTRTFNNEVRVLVRV